MSRAVRSYLWFVGLAVSITGTSAGCAHMIENRAITAFAKGLESHDLDRLKAVSSDDFSQRALRNADWRWKISQSLNLPEASQPLLAWTTSHRIKNV